MAKSLRPARKFGAERSGAASVLAATGFALMMGAIDLGVDQAARLEDSRNIQMVSDKAQRGGGLAKLLDRPRPAPEAGATGTRVTASTQPGGGTCVLALDESADGAVLFSGDTDIVSACGVASNSISNSAILVRGGAYVEVSAAQAYGRVDAEVLDRPEAGKGLYAKHPDQALGTRIADPYAGTLFPTDLRCDRGGRIYQDTELEPGTYCGDIRFKGKVKLRSGVYIIRGGDLSIGSSARVTADGPVTIFFTHRNAASIGGVRKIAPGAVVELAAPGPAGHPSGRYAGRFAGLLFVQDPRYQGDAPNAFTGGENMRLSGVIYTPSAGVDYRGGTDAAPGCLQIVAKTVTFSGASEFGNTAKACSAQGVALIDQQEATLDQ